MTIEDLPTIYAESMEIIQRAWREPERWTYKSERWEFNDIIVEPPCVQRPHPPMWQGAGSERSIRQAAREGYNLLLDQMTSFDGIAERVAIFRDEVEAAGRTFDPYSIGVTRGLMVADDAPARDTAHVLRNKFITEVQVLAADPKLQAFSFNPVAGKEATDVSEEGAIIGSSQEMADRIGRLHDAGVRNVLLHDLSGSMDALHQFAADVMPQFADRADTARAAE